jgi:murein DD-endopeptidase MepM/ murein hydrolase activator NlpD
MQSVLNYAVNGINQGDSLGTMGTTGLSWGKHLHIDLFRQNNKSSFLLDMLVKYNHNFNDHFVREGETTTYYNLIKLFGKDNKDENRYYYFDKNFNTPKDWY